jgi:spore maturation protein CgeB
MISSFPPTIEYFRDRGIPAELNRLGFEPEILPRLQGRKKIFDLTFIGSFTGVHGSRVELLEVLCAQFPQMRIWAPSIEHLASKTTISKCYAGSAWGREMYEILCTSRITINHHGDIAPYANNLRLYEATGVGTLLITDWKVNLHEIFEPGKEVATYRTSGECAALIQYYLEHDNERESIAKAGQQRTLREHSYFHRMQELVDIVTPLFRQHGKGRRDMSAG